MFVFVSEFGVGWGLTNAFFGRTSLKKMAGRDFFYFYLIYKNYHPTYTLAGFDLTTPVSSDPTYLVIDGFPNMDPEAIVYFLIYSNYAWGQ
jgi:hypothetical protein